MAFGQAHLLLKFHRCFLVIDVLKFFLGASFPITVNFLYMYYMVGYLQIQERFLYNPRSANSILSLFYVLDNLYINIFFPCLLSI